jgi:hypothetical protein
MKPVSILGIGTQSRSPNVTAQKRVNMYLEFEPAGDKTQVIAYGTPGLKLAGTIGTSSIRGMLAVESFLYVVIGNEFYKVTPGFTATLIGNTTESTGRVGMANNGLQLMIVEGAKGYIYTFASGAFAAIADADFPGGDTVAFNDSFFIVNKPDSGQFWISSSYNGTAWDGLDFATAESNPDNLIAVVADHGELILFSELSTEFWINSGGLNFPYSRISGAAMEWGIAARWTVAKFDNSLIWLAKNRLGEIQVMRLNGYTPERVSTSDIENIINKYTNVSGASAFSYMHNGHPFYQLNFDQGSWLYDGLSGAWSQLKGYGINRHRAEMATLFGDRVIVSDFENGNFYEPKGDQYTDNGEPLISELIGRHVFDNEERLAINQLQVDLEAGVGLDSGQGVDPRIILQTSKDGGHTWGNERFCDMGKVGEYKARAKWTRLGQARDWVFKLIISDPVKRVLINAWID